MIRKRDTSIQWAPSSSFSLALLRIRAALWVYVLTHHSPRDRLTRKKLTIIEDIHVRNGDARMNEFQLRCVGGLQQLLRPHRLLQLHEAAREYFFWQLSTYVFCSQDLLRRKGSWKHPCLYMLRSWSLGETVFCFSFFLSLHAIVREVDWVLCRKSVNEKKQRHQFSFNVSETVSLIILLVV